MKYAVEQRYYVTGFVDAYIREVDDNFKEYHNEGIQYDLWIDVFDTEPEAEIFLQECKEMQI